MEKNHTRKLTMAGILIATGVVCSPFSIPLGSARCFPVQHMVNILSAVFLGPFYGFSMAFITSLIRLMLGTGSLLAFPGSMCGALLCGLVFRYTQKLSFTYLGELFGTSILGALAAYPIATMVMGKEAALFAYVIPFFISCIGGVVLGAVLVAAIQKTGVMNYVINDKSRHHL
ncbi:energy coupling factor transporter S component ThiW [Eubacterium sp. AM05-23]|uniref:energy coupling factor transporter S component ThiW n=1 Tax=Eubacterium TaxID=1730 RepID=UPI000E4E55DE|nr:MULTISPECIES: energy coupling factor transporter S component ThiW [Eubacterium]RHO58880.1 energy coupling factor transporter S component ThiW [Eubacterium sp. AM05-23]